MKGITLPMISSITISAITLSEIDVLVGIACNIVIAAATVYYLFKKVRKLDSKNSPDGK